MGTITARKTKDYGLRFTVQIRKTKNKKLIYKDAATFASETAAKAWNKRQEAAWKCPQQRELMVNGQAAQRAEKTVRDVIQAYLDVVGENIGRTTAGNLDTFCRMDFGDKIAKELTAGDFAELARDLAKGVKPDPKDPKNATPDHFTLRPRAPSTVMSYMATLGTVIRYGGVYVNEKLPVAEYDEAMASLRHTKVVKKSNQRNRRPTLTELDLLMEYFHSRYQGNDRCVPMHKLVAAAIFKCHRQGELVRARWKDFDQAREKLIIHNLKHPRGAEGNHVAVMVSEEALAIVNSMPRRQDDDRVFPYHKDTVCRLFTEACKVLGIEDLHFHDLRHEGVSRLFELGMDVSMVAKHTGHKSWQTLQRYTHIEMQGDKYKGWPWWDVATEPL